MVHSECITQEIVDFDRFSKWERVLRAVAYIHRYIGNLRRRYQQQPRECGGLTQEELQMAENSLWRITQSSAYPDEVTVLKGEEKKRVDKTSKVFKLTPFLDQQSVMRMDSRIWAAPCTMYDFKFPIILPRDHRLTSLLIDWYHRKYLHGNHETIVNEIRQRFHISRLRRVVQQISKNCQTCKIAKAKPVVPRMAPLPEARLTPWIRPFTFVGLDYFGPLNVRLGRSCVKRWVALFTCLTVRASTSR
ncbi:uncharacterized protein LOC129766571 [Toxorhynchites rutilus septentrionalis]|uniref:uncharacterized protein LOC129766571 n=1 Tax=Toxorhynchites rutilus septentrionalis TaxID=329112 RepID=UPI0024799A12|nr:uncharacterized protein LOC129766571 [Toxorhynchites rutilus septentrionalis]